MITVLLADPHALHRLGLRTLLAARPGLTVAGEARTGTETARLHERLHPDVVLLGSGLPAADVTPTVRRLRHTPARVLVLSAQHREEHAYDALRAGADGFLPATTTPDELVAALFTVAAGDVVVSPGLTRALVQAVRHEARRDVTVHPDRPVDLTERERDVLKALAAGRSNAEIAAQLSIATTTVKSHVSRILTKIGARARVQAVIFAYESGLVRPPLPPAPHHLRTTHHEEPAYAYRWDAA